MIKSRARYLEITNNKQIKSKLNYKKLIIMGKIHKINNKDMRIMIIDVLGFLFYYQEDKIK